MYNKYLFLFVFFLSLQTSSSFSQDIPEKPKQKHLINDFAGIFSSEEIQQLEKNLVDFEQSTSTQIAVVTVTTLNGYDKAEFTYSLGEKWGIGQKGFDNGVVIMVKPKEIDGRGETFIAVGYGLEGVIPDAIAKRIVEMEMIPYFKQKNYFMGVAAAAKTIMGLAKGEFTAKEYEKKGENNPAVPFIIPLFILIFLIISLFGTVSQVRTLSIGKNISFWAALILLMEANRSHRGRYSSFSSGGGHFGSSGGFGGFGGGSFGGGGAGGSW